MGINKNHIQNPIVLLLHPASLALYVFIILMFSLPNYFQKYHAEITKTLETSKDQKVYYHDLDGDSITETIQLNNPLEYNCGVFYLDFYNNVINQWNLKGKWLYNPTLYFNDYNQNNFTEVYCLTKEKDSIYLNINELLNKDDGIIKKRNISHLGIFNDDKFDVHNVSAHFFDINKDGFDEIIFALFGGFSKHPRNTYIYDIQHDTLITSPLSASHFISGTQFMDLNEDSIPELSGIVYAGENIHYDIPFTDSSAWFMVLEPKKNLDYLFPPIKVGLGIASSSIPKFYQIGDQKYIVNTIYSHQQLKKSGSYNISLYSSTGKLLKERTYKRNKNNFVFIDQFSKSDPRFFLLKNKHQIYVSDTSLHPEFYCGFDEDINLRFETFNQLDINGDGLKEILFIAQTKGPEKLVIFNSNFKDPYLLDLPNHRNISESHITLKYHSNSHSPTLVFQGDEILSYIKYNKSSYYHLKYPTYIAAYLLLLLVFWLLQRAQRMIVANRYKTEMLLIETERKLMQHQMALSKKQMEPHFVLNMVNNIGYSFLKEDKQTAMYYLGKFADLLRKGLINADKIKISLEEELEFVNNFLILQKKLMDNQLEFSVKIDEQIEEDKIEIPHSLIYTFVENAIKHGLKPKESDRQLEIRVTTNNKTIQIIIKDNGIGRQKSKEFKTTDTGKGLDIIRTIITGYNQLNKRNITYKITDLKDENNEIAGSKVVLLI